MSDRRLSQAEQVSYWGHWRNRRELHRGAAVAESESRLQRRLSPLSLANEIANTLASSRALDVRSSAVTRKDVGADLDPQQTGRDLHVTTLLTGHFQKQETHVMVTVEAIETGTAGVASQSYGFDSRVDRLGGQLAKEVRQGFDAHAGRGRRRPRGLEVL